VRDNFNPADGLWIVYQGDHGHRWMKIADLPTADVTGLARLALRLDDLASVIGQARTRPQNSHYAIAEAVIQWAVKESA